MLWLALRVVLIVYTSGGVGFEYRFDVLELVSVLQRRLAEVGHARTRFGEVDAVGLGRYGFGSIGEQAADLCFDFCFVDVTEAASLTLRFVFDCGVF
jgi:hypothetical protein